MHDGLQLKQDILTSNSTVNVEQLTCNVSSTTYGLIINRTRQNGGSELMKLDSSSVPGQACAIHYKTDKVNWYPGVSYTTRFYWYMDGDRMSLDKDGSLDIGLSNNGAATGIKINNRSQKGNITGYTELKCESYFRSALHVFTSYYPELFIRLNNDDYMEFSGDVIRHYTPLTNSSDDRLKENEVLITNACETLSKLRPQIYDKKTRHRKHGQHHLV